MKKITLVVTAALYAQMGLAEGADETAIGTALKDLTDRAARVDALTAANVVLAREKTGLEVAIENLKATHTEQEVDGMLSVALKAGKITPALSTQLKEDYAGKPDRLKVVLDSRGAYRSVSEDLRDGGAAGDNSEAYEAYRKLSYDELWKQDKLPGLKAMFPDLYKAKHKARFGKEPE